MTKKEKRRARKKLAQIQERDPNQILGEAAAKIEAAKKGPGIDPVLMQRVMSQFTALNAAGKIKRTEQNNPYRIADHPPQATPPKKQQMAFDSGLVQNNDFASAGWLNGYGPDVPQFPGYPYLAELALREEFRVMSETIADDATREGIDFDVVGEDDKARARKDLAGEAERQADPDERRKRVKAAGKADKIKALKDDQERLELWDKLYAISRDDGFFGRSHLYMDFGVDVESGSPELRTPVGDGRSDATKSKIGKGKFKELKVIEAVWTYPQAYNANNPLAPGWYSPQKWFVMGQEIHGSRLPTFIGHVVPDLLKPAYSFGGISLSQLAQRYVDIWLQTKQSVADLVHSFSIMVLCCDVSTILEAGGAEALYNRADMFNMIRDNRGLMMINKATEDFKNVSASLGGLHELQAQAQEHMASIVRIPLVKLLGISPSGLNASSEGEIRSYYDSISAYQKRFFRPNLTKIVNFEQMSLFGDIDPGITIKFEPLWELSDKERGDKQKADADRHQVYVDMGTIDAGEVRHIIVNDKDLPYVDLDPDDVPDLGGEEAEGLEPVGGRPTPEAERGETNKEDDTEAEELA